MLIKNQEVKINRANIANPGERSMMRDPKAYAIGHEFGLITIVYADCDQDAIDEAVDRGKLDCMKMSDEDYAEYESNGWDDSYICAGNASEPFWSEHLWLEQIK